MPVESESVRAYRKRWAAANPEKKRAARKRWHDKNRTRALAYIRHAYIRTKYGVDQAWVDAKYAEQGNACAVCRKPFVSTPDIDHSHKTGKARALLCHRCNMGVAFAENEMMPKWQAYVEYHDRCQNQDGEGVSLG